MAKLGAEGRAIGLKAYSSTLKSDGEAIRMPGEASANDSLEITSLVYSNVPTVLA